MRGVVLMANFSATIPVDLVDAVNKSLEAQGFGPDNFAVPIAEIEGEPAKIAGLHCWHNPDFQAALVTLQATYPAMTITEGDGKPNFDAVVTARAWSVKRDVETWFIDPVMKDTTRTAKGKTWVSLMDFNVWEPPVGWREVVAVGFPAWVQPTGAHDAYKVGDKVRFEGKDFESVMAFNVWSPSAYPVAWRAL